MVITLLRSGRDTTSEIRELALRVQGEYNEMPGLCLTARQARRLWGVEREMCELVLATLIEQGFLRRTANGMYVRASG
jgi:hypothetical protein